MSSWKQETLNDVAKWGAGGTPSRSNPKYFQGKIPWLKISDFTSKYISNSEEKITESAIENSSAQLFPKGTVVVAMYGSVGKTAILEIPCTTSQAIAGAIVDETKVLNEFLYYYIISQQSKLLLLAQGGVQPNISQTILKAYPFRYPPIEIQKRIVNKINTLFSNIDQGAEQLTEAHIKTSQYKQSILDFALRGNLVPQKTKDEPASKLLERIQKEKEKLIAARKIKKEKPLAQISEVEKLFELPQGWTWTRLGNICRIVTSGSRGWADFYSTRGALFVRSQNINTDKLVLDDVAYVELPKKHEGQRTRIEKCDLLVTITGANITKCALVEEDLSEAYVSQHVALIRLLVPDMAKYLHLYLTSEKLGRKLLLAKTYGAGKPSLNLDNIKELPIPIPPIEEQKEIVAKVIQSLFELEKVCSSIHSNSKQAQNLKQSILKKAFEGEL